MERPVLLAASHFSGETGPSSSITLQWRDRSLLPPRDFSPVKFCADSTEVPHMYTIYLWHPSDTRGEGSVLEVTISRHWSGACCGCAAPVVAVQHLLWLCSTCCGCAAPAVAVQHLLWLCSACCGCAAPAAPVVAVQRLLWLCSTCCGCAAPAVAVQRLLWLCSACCGCAAPVVAVQHLLWLCSTCCCCSAPAVAVQADAGVTVPVTAATLESGVCRWSLTAVLASRF